MPLTPVHALMVTVWGVQLWSHLQRSVCDYVCNDQPFCFSSTNWDESTWTPPPLSSLLSLLLRGLWWLDTYLQHNFSFWNCDCMKAPPLINLPVKHYWIPIGYFGSSSFVFNLILIFRLLDTSRSTWVGITLQILSLHNLFTSVDFHKGYFSLGKTV